MNATASHHRTDADPIFAQNQLKLRPLKGTEMADRKAWAHPPDKESKHKRGYGREHVRLRAILLATEPLCRLCLAKDPPRTTPATIADHITPIAKGGAVHDLANLQPVCDPCHRDKTLRDQGKRVRPTIGLDGWPVE